MSVLYLVIIIVGASGQDIVKKMYTQKAARDSVFLFSALTAFFAMLFFIATLKDFIWNVEIIPYAFAFAISFAVTVVFNVLAVAHGPLSLSSLMISYSLMIPTFYGIVFLKEPISPYFLIGLGLLSISFFLVNKKNDKCPITPKWLLFVFLSFAGNGLCSTFQKMQQLAFDGDYKNEFMIISLAIVVFILGTVALILNKGNLKKNIYHARFTAAGAGIMNGIVNMLTMVLSEMMAVSVMFPLISAGNIVVTYLVSKIFYKEKLTNIQLSGFLTGIVSIVFLSI